VGRFLDKSRAAEARGNPSQRIRLVSAGERGAAVDEDVLSGLLLQVGNRVDDVALKQRLFHSSGSCKLVEATNFGRLLSVNGSPDRKGQEATNCS